MIPATLEFHRQDAVLSAWPDQVRLVPCHHGQCGGHHHSNHHAHRASQGDQKVLAVRGRTVGGGRTKKRTWWHCTPGLGPAGQGTQPCLGPAGQGPQPCLGPAGQGPQSCCTTALSTKQPTREIEGKQVSQERFWPIEKRTYDGDFAGRDREWVLKAGWWLDRKKMKKKRNPFKVACRKGLFVGCVLA